MLDDGVPDLGDCPRFVIPSYKLHTVWIAKFETGEKGNGLHAEQASVHIVAWDAMTLSTRNAARPELTAPRKR